MTIEDKIQYWIKSASYDWTVARHLFEKGDYPYALFFGHLTIEKILKGIYISKFDKTPPFTHRLIHLTEAINLELSRDKMELLEIITDFNLEARYPNEKFSFYKKCTLEFATKYMDEIEELREWLLRQIQSWKR
ncbi:HEPN domain-containing protein [Candidatus Magnetobacterium casense]|uniref:HEPN domain-containing protein n=1 Tax=Candidatus Magnetobacterium casense TaxID=1455061 RepID=A0ABS6RY85_9BACT|nr:HEPN domain-containing protein [Candidatus Magnetobacterium casensis]MBV6341600.1 HEPN domain-containing protein [Candidatus Magnetobacterium casensis]